MDDNHPRHILAVSGLIRDISGQVLMIRSPRRGWEIPGGQVETGEGLHQALLREVLEESGIHARIGPLAGIYSRLTPPHMMIFTFLGWYGSGEPSTSDESLETEWVTEDAVLERIHHQAVKLRVSDLLAFQGGIIYRIYSMSPFRVHEAHDLNDLHFSNPGE